MNDKENDLTTLFPAPVAVEVRGESLNILPLKVGQIPPLMRALGPAARDMFNGETIDWLLLLERHSDSVIDALAIAIGKPRTWMDALPPSDLLRLARAVLEINRDFFTQSVKPELDRMMALMAGSGQTPVTT
jgi:hypothetical protein